MRAEFADWLANRWLQPGRCLYHVRTLMDMPSDIQDMCRVCMGPTRYDRMHCWLEFGDAGNVIDLTQVRDRADLFEDQGQNYRRFAVQSNLVRRYSAREAAALVLSEGLTFWGFDLEFYDTRPPQSPT